MFSLSFVIALQAATTQPAALAVEAEQQTGAEAVAATPAAPERKRVCRSVIDNSTGPIAKRRKICRFVDDADNAAN